MKAATSGFSRCEGEKRSAAAKFVHKDLEFTTIESLSKPRNRSLSPVMARDDHSARSGRSFAFREDLVGNGQAFSIVGGTKLVGEGICADTA